MAAATSLAAASGLLLRGLQRLMAIEPGVDPRGVVTLEVGLPPNAPAAIEEAARYYRRLIDASRDTAGLTGLSAISRLPVVGAPASTGFELEGQPNPPGQAPVADLRYVEPGLGRFSACRSSRGGRWRLLISGKRRASFGSTSAWREPISVTAIRSDADCGSATNAAPGEPSSA